LKAKERADAGEKKTGLLAGVPRSLPGLLRAHEVGTRAAAVGFDWPSAAGVVDKIDEEVRELRAAIAEGPAQTVEEVGDLLFSLANLARKLGVEPESALRAANDKFTRRFQAVEETLAARGRSVHDATPEALEAAWNRVKASAATPASTSSHEPSGRSRRGRRSRA
jgi:nucleoside triphosphate diphosphatase